MRLRKPARKRDLLGIAIKTLMVNDSLICTEATLDNIRPRLDVFLKVYPDRTYRTFGTDRVRQIKRMA